MSACFNVFFEHNDNGGPAQTCRETGLPLGAHSVYKWSQCVTVDSVWALLSVGGLQPLVNISPMSQAQVTHGINVIMYILYCGSHFLTQSIPSTHSLVVLCIDCISQQFHMHKALLVYFTHTVISFLTLIFSLSLSFPCTHTYIHRGSLVESARVVIIHGKETRMSNQRLAH